MSLGLQTTAYIVAIILFILSLGGLSNQESAKRAVWFGIFGMALGRRCDAGGTIDDPVLGAGAFAGGWGDHWRYRRAARGNDGHAAIGGGAAFLCGTRSGFHRL